jgi:UDP-N-acetylmuramyl pentapeptide phosphotransferase/UDP-N-acetylglucosamine-1-phosphate transferase
MTFVVICALTATLSAIGIWLAIRKFGEQLVDIPNERSSHTLPTPRSGGIAFVAAFFVGASVAAVFSQGSNREILVHLLLVLLPLWVVGIIDDVRGLPASFRYLVHLGVAVLAITWFGPLAGADAALGSPWLGAFASVIAVTAMINFYNFMDGLDGLVSATSAIQLVFFALYLQQPEWWLLVAALLPCLLANWPPARLFMGDSGSTVLGAAAAIALLRAPTPAAVCTAGVVTLPILGDATFTLIRRLLLRENIFEAHKSHVYQRLNQSGWSHAQVSSAYVALTLGFALLVWLWELN